MVKNIIAIICFLLIGFLLYKCYTTKNIEGWIPYKQCPFGNWESAPNSQVYYVQKRYRKPYQYPWTFHSSYPLPHQRTMS